MDIVIHTLDGQFWLLSLVFSQKTLSKEVVSLEYLEFQVSTFVLRQGRQSIEIPVIFNYNALVDESEATVIFKLVELIISLPLFF
uniref:Uncharacterized protein n=1 Tax=Solanum lycopersicum TaxID=4081 RepID=A0A3Q7GI59_SOLLC